MYAEIPEEVRQLLMTFADAGLPTDDLVQTASAIVDPDRQRLALCELLAFAAENSDDPLAWLHEGFVESRWPLTSADQIRTLQALYRDWSSLAPPLCWSQLSRFGLTPHQLNLRAADEFWPLGETLHGYRLESRVAAGGFALVYRGVPIDGGLPVAVRVPRRVFMESDQQQRFTRLRHEAQLLANLHVPGVPRLIDCCETECGPVVFVELVDGRPWSRISPDEMPLRAQICCLARVADIVDSVHQSGVIHGDLKRENVLLNSQDEPILLDFNVSRRADPEASQLPGIAGTLAFMSPEALLSDSDDLDFRRDIYSLGVLLYELVTRLEWNSADSREDAVVAAVVKGGVQGPSFPEHVPETLRKIVSAAVSFQEFRRFETAADFADCCRQWLTAPTAELLCPPLHAQLTCWRLGLTLGLFGTRCQGLLQLCRTVSPEPADARLPRELLNRFDWVMGLTLGATEIHSLCSSLQVQIPQFTCDQPLATAFYRGSRLLRRDLPALQEQLRIAQDWWRNLIGALTRELPAVSESAWPLAELGIQTRFAPDSAMARSTWPSLAARLKLPAEAVAAFCETCRRNPDRSGWKTAIEALNYRLLKHLRWGTGDSKTITPPRSPAPAATD